MKLVKSIICLLALSSTWLYGDEWQSHWFNAINFLKDQNLARAIEEYTLSIQSSSLKPLDLYKERAEAYIKNGYEYPQDYMNAIQDLSYIISDKSISSQDKAYALWLRAQAYLINGMHKEFYRDVERLETIETQFVLIDETPSYATIKLASYLRLSENINQIVFQILFDQHIVNTESDINFTSSGIVIIKKAENSPSILELIKND